MELLLERVPFERARFKVGFAGQAGVEVAENMSTLCPSRLVDVKGVDLHRT